MRKWKMIFSILTIIFGTIGLMKVVTYNITLPVMFVFLGATFLVNAKEYYDKGDRKDAIFFTMVTIFIYVVTAINLISRFV